MKTPRNFESAQTAVQHCVNGISHPRVAFFMGDQVRRNTQHAESCVFENAASFECVISINHHGTLGSFGKNMFSLSNSSAAASQPPVLFNPSLLPTHEQHDMRSIPKPAFSGEFATAVLAAFRSEIKEIPIKFLYDEQGSNFFELEGKCTEYYIRRVENTICETHANEMVKGIKPGTAIVEFGSGSSQKVQYLMAATPNIATYIPIDIDSAAISAGTSQINANFPSVHVMPLQADFTTLSALPVACKDAPITGLFLGATIGNSLPEEAVSLLASYRFLLGQNSTLFIGADLAKDPAVLTKAYSGAATASMNLHILTRMNQKLDGDFDLDNFTYMPMWDERISAVEHRVVSKMDQTIHVAGEKFVMKEGTFLRLSQSVKYSLEQFTRVAHAAGWRIAEKWLADPEVAIFALKPMPAPVSDALTHRI